MSSVKQIIREPDLFMFPTWNESISYYTNAIVSYYDSDSKRHKFYVAQQDIAVGDVPTLSRNWLEFSYDSEHLTAIIERLWDEQFDYFRGYIREKIDSESNLIYDLVDSELRELRADVNVSLLNNLTISKQRLDSEITVLKAYVNSQDTKLKLSVDSDIRIVNFNRDSDRNASIARDVANLTYLSTRIAQEKANHDSDLNALNTRFVNEQLSVLSKFARTDSDSAKIKDVQRQVWTLATTVNSFNSQISLINIKQARLDSDFLTMVRTHASIYRDIQSNRDRIIVLENTIQAEIQELVTNNATLNNSILGQIANINADLSTHDTTHVSIFNDLADLRSTVNKVKNNAEIDSDFINSLVNKVVINNRGTDSDWVIRWVNKTANPQVDSDWIRRTQVSFSDSDDVAQMVQIVKDNLDFGTF